MPASAIQLVSVLDRFDRLRNSFDEVNRTGEPRYAQLFKRISLARLLVQGDVGAERPTEWTRGATEQTHRYPCAAPLLPTWFTTNCSLEELEPRLSPRTYSRLVYQAAVLEVTGPDLRKLCR